MLKYYLLTAWQHLARQKLFAAINIVGLAIGLSVFILIFLYVKKEYSWDRHWEHADRLHWLTFEFHINDSNSFKNFFSPFPAMQMVRDNFPEAIDKSARVLRWGTYVRVGEGDDNRYGGGVLLADRQLLDIVQLDVVSGSLEDVFAVPGRIALREDFKEVYFGQEDALGKIITVEQQDMPDTDYRVAAVYRSPDTTSLNFGNLGLLEEATLPEAREDFASWQGRFRAMNLFLLKPGADIASMNERLPGLVDTLVTKEPWRFLQPGQSMSDFHEYAFQHLPEAHFDDSLRAFRASNQTKVNVFAMIGVLVLVMGSINFVILATARADDRRREVGIRKVLGADKRQLLAQYMGESVIQTLVALALAFGLASLALPVFSTLIDQELTLSLLGGWTVVQLVVLAIVIGMLGGVYPALVMAEFSIASVFKPAGHTGVGRVFNVRSVLSCLQFSIAIALIIATGVLYSQLNLVRNLDPGFRTDNLFTLFTNPQDMEMVAPLYNELQALPGVERVVRSSIRPGPEGMGITTFGTYRLRGANEDVEWAGMFVDYDFFDLYEIPLLAGRTYDRRLDTIPDSGQSQGPRLTQRVVINRRLAQSLGYVPAEDAAGQVIDTLYQDQDGQQQTRPVEIIGVVENTRFYSLREAPASEAYLLSDRNLPIFTMEYVDAYENNITADVEALWDRLVRDGFSRTAFVRESLLSEFVQEENEGRLLLTFAGLAIFIACIGLYGIAAYTVKKSVKEIGIRKVLGASSRQVLRLFMWRFSIPVLVANIIAWPVAVYAMLSWLQRYAEQIEYGTLLSICLLATVLALLIAWVTVGLTTVRAARANPVKSLRYE